MRQCKTILALQCMGWMLAALICFLGAVGQSVSAEPDSWCVTPDSAWEFAHRFYEKEDWRTAATEFDRFVHFFPGDGRAPEAAFKAGMARFFMQDYPAAIEAFKETIRLFDRSGQTLESRFMISRCYQKLDDADRAVQVLEQIIAAAADEQIRDRALNQLGWLFLDAQDLSRARTAFSAISEKNQQRYHTRQIVSALDQPGRIEYKSPLAAGLLSIVPGGGYLYTGRYREAGVAFLLTGALAVASWQCFDEDLPALGAITGLVGLGFYSGSIAGGIGSAHKYNHRAGERFVRELKAAHGPLVSLHFQREGAMLVFHGSF